MMTLYNNILEFHLMLFITDDVWSKYLKTIFSHLDFLTQSIIGCCYIMPVLSTPTTTPKFKIINVMIFILIAQVTT